jgi:8-oxo-dGTP pyrophosphatase MutT (NUDIX family)
MTHQTAGAVLFSPKLDKVYLIHKKERDEWLLPKGHIEDGERLVDTAKREVREETGYSNFVILGSIPFSQTEFEFDDHGTPSKKIISFFCAVLIDEDRLATKEQEAEGLDGDWLTVDEAISKAAYEDIKENIKKAHEQITALGSSR